MDPSNLNRWASRALWQEAATLAFMREGPRDIRPGLLLLFHAQDSGGLDAILLHGMAYLRSWCDVRRMRVTRATLEIASGDALAVMWCRRAPHPVAARSRQLGVRNQRFFDLRTAALHMYQARLHEARVRFMTGTIYTHQSLEWKIGPAPPSKSPAAAPGNARRPDFPKAA